MIVVAASENKPLELRAAERLVRFVERDFDPKSETSWETLRTMWRGALLTRDIAALWTSGREVSK